MRYWWVNQNQTYRYEFSGGYLWSPKVKKNGSRNHFYDSMTQVSSGDLVFSFVDTEIKSVGVVSSTCISAPKPREFGNVGSNWAQEGWYLSLAFRELVRPIRPKDHMGRLGPVLPLKYSPLQTNGNGMQGVYLASLPPAFAEELISLLDGQVEAILSNSTIAADANDSEQIIQLVDGKSVTYSATERSQLILARIGQGLFRSRVTEVERCCRVTDINDSRFLIASHIKPWSKSEAAERLDGNNGLLLAPHIDHLFDKGFITFDDDGRLQRSLQLPAAVGEAWRLGDAITPRPLNAAQSRYMQYHRDWVFRDA